MIITSFVGILASSQSRVESSADHSPQQQQNRDDDDDNNNNNDDGGDDRKADNVLSSSINQDAAYIEDVYADVDHETKQNNADDEDKDQVSQLSLQYFIPTSASSPLRYYHHPYHYYEHRYHYHFQQYHHHHFSCIIIFYLMFYSLVLDSLQCS